MILFVIGLKITHKPDPYRHLWFERPQEKFKQEVKPRVNRNAANRMNENQVDILVLYGSQSGRGEGLARRLTRALNRSLQVKACSLDLGDVDAETLAELPSGSIAIFFLSTYGNGDPSDSAAEFVEYLTSKCDRLPSLQWAMFGLGNSNYQYYNKVADVVSDQLSGLCSRPPLLTGKSDEATNNVEESFLEWKDHLICLLGELMGLAPQGYKYEPAISIQENVTLHASDLAMGEPLVGESKVSTRSGKSAASALSIVNCRDLTTTRADGARCLHVELDLSAHGVVKYKTGDYLAVWPSNPDREVRKLLIQLGLESKSEKHISITELDGGNGSRLGLPRATTIKALFKHYLQVCSPVSRETISSLCYFAPSTETHSWLSILSEAQGYRQFFEGKYLTLADLLEQSCRHDSGWDQLPLAFVVECLPVMLPRRYSIASSPLVAPTQISLTVAVKAPMLQGSVMVIPGLATSYLTNAAATRAQSQPLSVCSQIIRSKFKPPTNSGTPLILIAAGSGIAPFRAFIQERARLRVMGHQIGSVLLIFGCRQPQEDYLYRDELETAAAQALQGKLKIITAFSRDSGPRHYVQDRLRESGLQKEVSQSLVSGASIYFCGSTIMAKAASSAVQEGLETMKRALDPPNVVEWVDKMKRSNKWQEDVWG